MSIFVIFPKHSSERPETGLMGLLQEPKKWALRTLLLLNEPPRPGGKGKHTTNETRQEVRRLEPHILGMRLG